MSAEQDVRTLQQTLPSSLDQYHGFVKQVLDELEALGWPSTPDLFAIHMALEESISNAIRHGNKEDESKKVEVECRISPTEFWAKICDEGDGFCPDDVPDCREQDRLDVPGGRGLALIKAYMTRMEYNACGNCVTLVKGRDDESSNQAKHA